MTPPLHDPTNADRERLRQQLLVHEGLRLRPYVDLRGKLTIGIGRNLTDVGISAAEAYALLDADIDAAVRWLTATHDDWFPQLAPARQAAIVNMVFNVGPGTFQAFHGVIAALRAHDYAAAASAMLDSRWAVQVGKRATELAAIVLHGAWPLGAPPV